MVVPCPHCGQDIELVGAGELNDEFGIGPNALQHAREVGRFPDPWISFGNRKVYLRSDVEEYVSARARATVEKTVSDLLATIEHLPAEEQKAARDLLEMQLRPPRARTKRS